MATEISPLKITENSSPPKLLTRVLWNFISTKCSAYWQNYAPLRLNDLTAERWPPHGGLLFKIYFPFVSQFSYESVFENMCSIETKINCFFMFNCKATQLGSNILKLSLLTTTVVEVLFKCCYFTGQWTELWVVDITYESYQRWYTLIWSGKTRVFRENQFYW